MIVATTPILTLTLPNTIDLTTATEIYVTLSQGKNELTKTDVTLQSANVITVLLSQEETLMFNPNGFANVQVNWITNTGRRIATKIKSIRINPNLIPEVLP